MELNESNFKDFTSKGKVVVDFWAEWCGPCKMMKPVFEELKNEMTDINFGKLNVDEAGDISANQGVKGIPTIILYKDGEEVNRIVGFLPKDSLKQKIIDGFK